MTSEHWKHSNNKLNGNRMENEGKWHEGERAPSVSHQRAASPRCRCFTPLLLLDLHPLTLHCTSSHSQNESTNYGYAMLTSVCSRLVWKRTQHWGETHLVSVNKFSHWNYLLNHKHHVCHRVILPTFTLSSYTPANTQLALAKEKEKAQPQYVDLTSGCRFLAQYIFVYVFYFHSVLRIVSFVCFFLVKQCWLDPSVQL